MCPLCSNMLENMWHLFMDCSYASDCWRGCNLWSKIDTLCYDVESHIDLFLQLLRLLDTKEMDRIFMVVWAIWRARNDRVWNDNYTTPAQVIHSAVTFLGEWKEVRVKPARVANNGGSRKWHAPKERFYEDQRRCQLLFRLTAIGH